jgi:hypothetical protein
MPNHVHALLYFPEMPKSLNIVIGNAKRFLAYEIIKRLEDKKANSLLDILHAGVRKESSKKDRYTRFLKTVSMQRNVIPQNLFCRNLSICIATRLVKNGNL